MHGFVSASNMLPIFLIARPGWSLPRQSLPRPQATSHASALPPVRSLVPAAQWWVMMFPLWTKQVSWKILSTKGILGPGLKFYEYQSVNMFCWNWEARHGDGMVGSWSMVGMTRPVLGTLYTLWEGGCLSPPNTWAVFRIHSCWWHWWWWMTFFGDV